MGLPDEVGSPIESYESRAIGPEIKGGRWVALFQPQSGQSPVVAGRQQPRRCKASSRSSLAEWRLDAPELYTAERRGTMNEGEPLTPEGKGPTVGTQSERVGLQALTLEPKPPLGSTLEVQVGNDYPTEVKTRRMANIPSETRT